MTYEEVAAAVIAAPGVVEGFLQHYIGVHKDRSVRNQGGGFQSEHSFHNRYRVCLYGDRQFDVEKGQAKGPFADVEHDDLMTAVRMAFEKMKLPLPDFVPRPKIRQPLKK